MIPPDDALANGLLEELKNVEDENKRNGYGTYTMPLSDLRAAISGHLKGKDPTFDPSSLAGEEKVNRLAARVNEAWNVPRIGQVAANMEPAQREEAKKALPGSPFVDGVPQRKRSPIG